MQTQKQTQPFVESEEFLILLSEEEQAIIAGGDGKHRKPGPKHAKPTSLLRRGLGLGLKVGARAIPVVGTAWTIYEIGKFAYDKHNEEGHWWSFL